MSTSYIDFNDLDSICIFLTVSVPSNCLYLGVLLVGGIEDHDDNISLESVYSTHVNVNGGDT